MNNVYVRIAVYVLSTLLGSLPAVAMGWFSYQYVDGLIQVSIHVEGAISALATAFGLSAGVFQIWGKK